MRSENKYLCASCHKILPFQSENSCPKCGLNHESVACDSDWAKDIATFNTIFRHELPIRQWISGLKYSRNLTSGNLLTQFVNQWFAENQAYHPQIEWIIPVPLHAKRLRHRGFNQSHWLLRKQRAFQVNTDILVRVRNTHNQAGLSRKERHNNLKKAFLTKKNLRGNKVLLFDDVCTSGQTIYEAKKTLLRAGADEVHVLVLSRATDSP